MAALRMARKLGIRLTLDVSDAEVTRLRRMTDDLATPQLYTDQSMTDLILSSLSLEAAAAQIWEEKAAYYLTMSDISESSSVRKNGDLYVRAMQMASYYRQRADVINPNPYKGGRATTRAIVRP